MNNNEEITTSTHVFLAIATACFMWILVVLPTISKIDIPYAKYSIILISLFIILVVLPSIIIHKKLYTSSIADEDMFVLMKILAIILSIGARKIFVMYYAYKGNIDHKKSWFYFIMTLVIMLTLSANIAEAVYTQIDDRNKPIGGEVTETNSNINIINGVIGIVLVIILFIMFIRGHRFDVRNDNKLYMMSMFGLPWILAYTLWNVVFVMQTGGIPTFMFFCSTLLLPIIAEYTGTCDWLEARGITLIMFIILMFGMGHNQKNIFPMYNDLDENHANTDFQDELTRVDYNDNLKISILSGAGISTVAAVFYSFF